MGKSFKKLLEIQRKEYRTWQPIYCKAIQSHVHFNMQGFNHLRFKPNNVPRDHKEISYKLSFLPLVREAIKNATTVAKYRKNNYYKTEYWALIETVRKQKIRVVLRKTSERGAIHFWSVMGN